MGWLKSKQAKRAYFTFLIAFAVLVIPGALGWLHDVTAWAESQGQDPFPEATSLWFVVVQGIVAGTIALVNLLWNFVESKVGKSTFNRA